MKPLFDALAAEGAHVEPNAALALAIDYGDIDFPQRQQRFGGVPAASDHAPVKTAGPAR